MADQVEIDDYLDLIPAANRNKPNFISTVTTNISVAVRVQNLLASMIPLFDVDIAVGQQLDVIGLWVGVTRNVKVPIAGVYFSWDGTDATGWDFGTWQADLTPGVVTVLPDDAFRTLIKGKIGANHWDGTTDGAYVIWEELFPNFTILIQDYQNMSYDIAIVGGVIDSLTLALLTGGYIPLKPEGVRINKYLVAVDDGPLFGWDMDTDFVKGWDTGSWANEIDPT